MTPEEILHLEINLRDNRWNRLKDLISSRVEVLNTPERKNGIIRPLLDRIRRNRADALMLVLDDMKNLEEK